MFDWGLAGADVPSSTDCRTKRPEQHERLTFAAKPKMADCIIDS